MRCYECDCPLQEGEGIKCEDCEQLFCEDCKEEHYCDCGDEDEEEVACI